jgi:hypothetical protein
LGLLGISKSSTTWADEPARIVFTLVPASDAVAACLPDAKATVTVAPLADIRGTDALRLKVSGLPPNTDFVLFLTELPVPPFGAVQYIGDYTTDKEGKGSVKVNAIILEAFSSQLVDADCDPNTPPIRHRVDLKHMVSWFADPAGDEFCLPGSGATPFDGDGQAGSAVLSSRNALPGAPLP